MSLADRLSAAITAHSRSVVAVVLVLTVVAGAGTGMLEQSSSLDQFQSDSPEAEKLEYVEEHFSTGPNNTTSAQLIVRGDDVLSRESTLGLLRLQRAYRANETVDGTLVGERPIVGVPNLVALSSIAGDRRRQLQATAEEIERRNATVRAEGAAIERRSAELNATRQDLRAALDTLRENRSASPRAAFEAVRANASVDLDDTQYARFNESAQQLRAAETEPQIREAYRLGTRGVLADEYAALEDRVEALESQRDRLGDLGDQLQAQRAALANASAASLDDQVDAVESMNATEYDRALAGVLGGDRSSPTNGLTFMPTHYRPGSTSANATMLLVTQRTDGGGQSGVSSDDRIVDAQLAMQSIASETDTGGTDVAVFGGGIMGEEIDNSMVDSLAIVGPLALLFVVVALVVAYRDLLDILLGLFGIVVVLVWTFGLMGWAGIDFNQLFVAVPVLLIGLSIDYAIHIFMRHREQRQGDGSSDGDDVRGSMRVALAGVGVALVWVTATTAIGFLSNLTSPVPPIRDFGVVSAAGIAIALLVFGALIPALKIELDGILERRGVDRSRRAFGTGGGRVGQVLATGATAARRAPIAMLLLALLVSAGGAYGATQVDTSFDQEDFIAEDPPAWTKSLPGPFRPGDYSMKENLAFVNRNFVRQDARAQILVEGDVATPDALRRLAAAETEAADSDVVVTLASGEADLRSPLRTMRQVAARNASFDATFTAADTDGDGVPDRNVEAVYDHLFAVAPDEAAGVVHRIDDGDYRAVRLVVSTRGTASGGEVASEMRRVADGIDGGDLEATATGRTILFEIVQDQLMDTVVRSLLLALVAVFAFLMLTYRLTEGSAVLGAVTLLPVLSSVSWILGTMYLLDIPFNVMTGMITSLTVGLGVAYSIHVSERYTLELDRTGSVWEAMSRTVTGTGGALLGSAATTVGGFGVLAFAILPPLQQFGIITGLTIVYAFLASVLVLPSLLVVWTRYLGPDVSFDAPSAGPTASATSDGGRDDAGPAERDDD